MHSKPLAQCSCVLLTGLLLASCSNSTRTSELPGGLKVTPVAFERSDITTTDIAEILDLKMWRLGVTLPKPSQLLICNLEIREKGKAPRTIGGVGAGGGTDSKAEVTIGLHPLSDSWSKSDQIKTLVRVTGGSSSGVKSNPSRVTMTWVGDNPKYKRMVASCW